MELEAKAAPDFFPIYLGGGEVDREEMAWLHDAGCANIELADRILVPSEHIAGELVAPWHASRPDRASCRMPPTPAGSCLTRTRRHGASCTFLFAGGITQRKGIKYLLEAWRLVRRPGWRLQLLGALPADPGPLVPYLDEVEWLGRLPHAEVPARMAAADVFVFPSLFEGSAVVTYEAHGLRPALHRHCRGRLGGPAWRDGLIVPARDVDALAAAMERLGGDASLPGGLLRLGPDPGRGSRLAPLPRRRDQGGLSACPGDAL